MLALTRRPARIGLRDGIHILGVNGMPRLTSSVWDACVILGIRAQKLCATVPRFCPAVGFQLIELVTRFKVIILTTRSSTDPTKGTPRRKTGSAVFRGNDKPPGGGVSLPLQDHATNHHKQHTRYNSNHLPLQTATQDSRTEGNNSIIISNSIGDAIVFSGILLLLKNIHGCSYWYEINEGGNGIGSVRRNVH